MTSVGNADSEAGSSSAVWIFTLLFAVLISIGAWYYNAHHRVELNRLNGDTIATPLTQAPAAPPPGVPPSASYYSTNNAR